MQNICQVEHRKINILLVRNYKFYISKKFYIFLIILVATLAIQCISIYSQFSQVVIN